VSTNFCPKKFLFVREVRSRSCIGPRLLWPSELFAKKIERQKKGQGFDLALGWKKLQRDLSTGAGQRVHPALHPIPRILDVFITEPFF
jgi:hypothetical protein